MKSWLLLNAKLLLYADDTALLVPEKGVTEIGNTPTISKGLTSGSLIIRLSISVGTKRKLRRTLVPAPS